MPFSNWCAAKPAGATGWCTCFRRCSLGASSIWLEEHRVTLRRKWALHGWGNWGRPAGLAIFLAALLSSAVGAAEAGAGSRSATAPLAVKVLVINLFSLEAAPWI